MIDSLLHEATTQLAEQYARKLDGIISTAISAHLNGAPWKIEDMKGRLRMVVRAHNPNAPKTLYLDGAPILEIYSPDYETDAHVLSLIGRYRFYPAKEQQ